MYIHLYIYCNTYIYIPERQRERDSIPQEHDEHVFMIIEIFGMPKGATPPGPSPRGQRNPSASTAEHLGP